ncbi:MAG: c-type cytochrome domain-containing protein [Pseudomonadota bacterium]|nr:c-type cytochrome domain-containing protein [Pseudomonadota bacterium]
MLRDDGIHTSMSNMSYTATISLIITSLACLCIVGCTTRPQVSYQRDVYPVLEAKCIGCHIPPHGEGYKKTGLDLASYDTLMEGTFYGPVIVSGDSRRSTLNMLVEGRAGDLSRVLKEKHNPTTDHEIEVLRLWVEQGASNN